MKPKREEIIDAALEAGSPIVGELPECGTMSLEKFYLRAYKAGMLRAAEMFNTELGFCHDPMGQEALNEMSQAIKAEAEKLNASD